MTEPSLPPRNERGRRAVFFVVALALALAAAEAGWRAFVPQSSAERDSAEYIRTSRRYLTPCAAVEKHDGTPALVGRLLQNTGGAFAFPLAKQPGVHRVAFVGESSGVMFGGAAFNLLSANAAGAAWQLMNCAESGTTVEHVERRADEVLAYAPDVLVVVFGHNWMMPRMPMNDLSLRVQELLSRSRLISGVAHRLSSTAPTPPIARDPAERLARLEAFLRHVARAARERGVAVVLTTLTPNFWFPPLIEEDALGDRDFLEAMLEYVNGRTSTAIERLQALAVERPQPYWSFVLGTWLAREGDAERAVGYFQAAIDGEREEADRATSAVNDLIRRVAEEEGTVLHDGEREMSRIADGGAPGWDVMRDHCHLQPRYATDEARALLDIAARVTPGARRLEPSDASFAGDDVVRWMLDGLATVQSQLRDARSRRYQRALSYFVERWSRVAAERTLADVADFLAGTVFAGLSADQKAAVLESIADGLEWAGLREQALTTNALARSALGLSDAAAGDAPARDVDAAGAAPAGLVSPYAHIVEANAWIQLGLLRLAAREPSAAADAFRRALAVAPRKDAVFFLDAALAEGGE